MKFFCQLFVNCENKICHVIQTYPSVKEATSNELQVMMPIFSWLQTGPLCKKSEWKHMKHGQSSQSQRNYKKNIIFFISGLFSNDFVI